MKRILSALVVLLLAAIPAQAQYHGDIDLGDTVDCKFTTTDSAGAPVTIAGTPSLAAYIGNSTTEITAGLTLSLDFDGRTGMHNIRMVATSGNGYTTGTDVQIAIVGTTPTAGGTSVLGYVPCTFSIDKRSALRPATAARTLVVDAAGLADANVVKLGPTGSGTTQTARDIGASVIAASVSTGGIVAASFAAGAIDAAAIAADAIGASEVAADAIGASEIAADAIGSSEIATDAIGAAEIATDAIGAAEIAASAITSSEAANLDAAVSSRASQTSLDTVDDFVDTEVAAIKTKTDFLPSATAGAAGGVFISGTNTATTITAGAGLDAFTLNAGAASGATPAGVALRATGGAASTTGGGVSGAAVALLGGAGAASTNGAAAGLTSTGGGTTTVTGGAGAVWTGTGNLAGISFAGAGSGAGLLSTAGATGHGASFVGGATSGNGIRAAGTAGNSPAMNLIGQGSGAGLLTTGGATGNGATFAGGATSGAGATFTATSGNGVTATGGTNGTGMALAGAGSGKGLEANAGTTGIGFNIGGGGTSGEGVHIETVDGAGITVAANGTNKNGATFTGGTDGHGLVASGTGTGAGFRAVGGATGNGATFRGGATSGHGLQASVTSGNEIDADLVGAITGSLSGSVGSVTGNVGGNVTGSVGSVAAGGITASSVAADAIGASELAADAVTEIQSGLSTLDASGVRTAVGLATGNLDTQLSAIDDFVDTEVAAIKTKTDFLPSATAGAAGGVFIAGTNAPVTVTGSGNAFTLTSTGADGAGLAINGNGTEAGVNVNGGATDGAALQLNPGGTGPALYLNEVGGGNLSGLIAGLPTDADITSLLRADNGPAIPSALVVTDGGNSITQAKTDRGETVDNFWKDSLVLFGGTCNIAGQVAKLTTYNGTSKIITWTPAKTAVPDDGCTIWLINR